MEALKTAATGSGLFGETHWESITCIAELERTFFATRHPIGVD